MTWWSIRLLYINTTLLKINIKNHSFKIMFNILKLITELFYFFYLSLNDSSSILVQLLWILWIIWLYFSYHSSVCILYLLINFSYLDVFIIYFTLLQLKTITYFLEKHNNTYNNVLCTFKQQLLSKQGVPSKGFPFKIGLLLLFIIGYIVGRVKNKS